MTIIVEDVRVLGCYRHISPSGDLQGVRDIDALHPGQDMELFMRFFWNRKSRAFSREAVGSFISFSRQKSTMSGIGIVVVVVDDGNCTDNTSPKTNDSNSYTTFNS